jgi:serine protease Do
MTLAQGGSISQDDINRISDSVVLVAAIEGDEITGTGSGTIINSTGLIFTNDHVIAGADAYMILMNDEVGEPPVPLYFASVVETFPDFDFALLQIEADIDGQLLDVNSLNMPFISLAPIDPALGEDVYIFGFPSIADGFLVMTSGKITTIQNGTINDVRLPVWYQTDAEISPGNSGGLAVNTSGEFVGIPTEVRMEDRTGGRLGGLIPLSAIAMIIELDRGTAVAQAQQQQEQPAQQQQQQEQQAQQQQQQQPPANTTAAGALDYTLAPSFGGTTLAAGFMPDPFHVEIVSGGAVNTGLLSLGQDCLGFAAQPPDYRIQFSGASQGLRLFFVGNGDTTLLVNDSAGAWHCGDDSFETSAPTVDILNPPAGQYDIWVGSYIEGENITGTLYITERASVTPVNPAGS